MFGHGSSKFDESLVLKCPDTRRGRQQRIVTLEQFLGHKTHAVGHLLLARERLWYLLKVRPGDFDEPTNLPVLPNLQAGNGQGFAEVCFVGLEPRRPLSGDGPQTVHFLIDAVAQEPSFPKRQGRGINQRPADAVSHRVQRRQTFSKMLQERVVNMDMK